MKKVSMQDIADVLNISKVSVSKAFKESLDISSEMKKKIIKVADELGYSYKARQRISIGVLSPSIFLEKDESFYTRIFKNLNEHSNKYNMHLSLNIISEADQESNKRIFFIQDMSSYDGIIILGQLKKSFVKHLLKLNTPIVLMDFHYRGIAADSIIGNNFQASYELTSHLIEYGHSEIGFLGNIKTTTSIQDRYLGFVKAMLENNLNINDSYMIEDRDDENNLIDIFFPKVLPTAYVCNSDYSAYALTKKLEILGYNVPKDISVVGFDDLQYSEFVNPKLTTVRVGREDMAKIALKRINNRINDKSLATNMFVITSKLIYRDSVMKRAEPIK